MALQTLTPRSNSSLFAGFNNLFDKEMGDWWRSRRWMVTLVMFIVVIGGLLLMITMSDDMIARERDNLIEAGATMEEIAVLEAEIPGAEEMVMMYFIFSGLVLMMTAIVLAQDAVVGERQLGTAQWIISKPATRMSFILSKFAAHSIGLAVLGAGVQGAVSYAVLRLSGDVVIDPVSFVLASGVLMLAVMFFLALTLMLGTFFDSRAIVVGVPIGLLLMFQFITGLVPQMVDFMPYTLVMPLGQTYPVALEMALGMPVTNIMPAIATAVWIVVFLMGALWRFSQEDF